MITVSEARATVAANVSPGSTEQIPLARAGGRILRQAVAAERPAPPFNRVMMDGLALCAASWARNKGFAAQQQLPAGIMPPPLQDTDSVFEVMTGGLLPPGCDSVVPIEWCRREGDAWIIDPPREETIQPGRFFHAQGSDGPAGRTVLAEGARLGPAELAAAATEGACTLVVNRLPRIHLITTGDEIVPPEQRPGPAQIRGSHAVALTELLLRCSQAQVAHHHVPDAPDALAAAVASALPESDFLLLTGGVSRGRWDLVPELLQSAGVEQLFHRVSQRPGKPLWFGKCSDCLVFGLPGNPNSAQVCARIYVAPALDLWRGARPRPAPAMPIESLPERHGELTLFVPLWPASGGRLMAIQPATSGSLHAFCGSIGLAELPPVGEPSLPTVHFWRLCQ